MRRAILTVAACFCLAGCGGWVSDERLFGDGDWARLNVSGPYTFQYNGPRSDESAPGDREAHATLTTRPDGLLQGTGEGPDDGFVIGLVPIDGGSGDYFLMVDRSDETAQGDQYFIAHQFGRGFAFFFPDCEGTPAIDGMRKVRIMEPAVEAGEDDISASDDAATPDEYSDDPHVCKFDTKEALMKAGLNAERFLSARHAVEVAPFATITPDEESDEAVAN